MHGNLPADAQRAIFPPAGSCADSTGIHSSAGSCAESPRWFADLARFLSDKKPSATIQFLTGEPERTCQAWTADYEKPAIPKANILAKLLRSGEGDHVLEYIMRGCTAPWWRDYRTAAKKAALLEQHKQSIEQLQLDLALE
jgi:hypothetical protein